MITNTCEINANDASSRDDPHNDELPAHNNSNINSNNSPPKHTMTVIDFTQCETNTNNTETIIGRSRTKWISCPHKYASPEDSVITPDNIYHFVRVNAIARSGHIFPTHLVKGAYAKFITYYPQEATNYYKVRFPNSPTRYIRRNFIDAYFATYTSDYSESLDKVFSDLPIILKKNELSPRDAQLYFDLERIYIRVIVGGSVVLVRPGYVDHALEEMVHKN